MRNIRPSMAALLGGVGLVASTAAPCAPIAFSVSTSDVNSPDAQTLNFLQFDAALGTLTGVTFTLSSQTQVGASVQGSFGGGEGGNASAMASAVFTMTGPSPGSLSLFSGNGSATASCSDAPSGGITCASAGSVPTLPVFPLASPFSNPPTDLSAFIGNGSSFFDVFVELDVSSLLQTCTTVKMGQGQGSCTKGGSADWSGSLDVTYRFTPAGAAVPEPMSLALVGLGLAGLGFSRRKR